MFYIKKQYLGNVLWPLLPFKSVKQILCLDKCYTCCGFVDIYDIFYSFLQLASVMDIARASIAMCVNSVKILPQESSVKTVCQVITGIRLTEDSARVSMFSFTSVYFYYRKEN